MWPLGLFCKSHSVAKETYVTIYSLLQRSLFLQHLWESKPTDPWRRTVKYTLQVITQLQHTLQHLWESKPTDPWHRTLQHTLQLIQHTLQHLWESKPADPWRRTLQYILQVITQTATRTATHKNDEDYRSVTPCTATHVATDNAHCSIHGNTHCST